MRPSAVVSSTPTGKASTSAWYFLLRLAQLASCAIPLGDVIGRYQHAGRPPYSIGRTVCSTSMIVPSFVRWRSGGTTGVAHRPGTVPARRRAGPILGRIEVVAAHRQQLSVRPAVLPDGGLVHIEQRRVTRSMHEHRKGLASNSRR